MVRNSKKSSLDKLYKVSIITAFVAVLTAASIVSFKYIRLRKDKKMPDVEKVVSNSGQQVNTPAPAQTENLLKEYINEEYGYKVKYNKFLDAREYEDTEEYLNFVKFEENQFSNTKGFAIGVTSRTREEEKGKITAEFEERFETSVEDEKEVKVGKHDGIELRYSQKEDLEPRSIVIVNNGSFTFSISTVPDQMDEILSSFEFL